mmetsp:Transcript_6458/g.11980  ORF Transcript_6458/g.11980 Transcript_6458/m.11980 type:complete len:290 (+) Transcript_6458:2262-3131(+)
MLRSVLARKASIAARNAAGTAREQTSGISRISTTIMKSRTCRALWSKHPRQHIMPNEVRLQPSAPGTRVCGRSSSCIACGASVCALASFSSSLAKRAYRSRRSRPPGASQESSWVWPMAPQSRLLSRIMPTSCLSTPAEDLRRSFWPTLRLAFWCCQRGPSSSEEEVSSPITLRCLGGLCFCCTRLPSSLEDDESHPDHSLPTRTTLTWPSGLFSSSLDSSDHPDGSLLMKRTRLLCCPSLGIDPTKLLLRASTKLLLRRAATSPSPRLGWARMALFWCAMTWLPGAPT